MKTKLLDLFKRILETTAIDETVSQTSCAKWDSIRHLNLIVEIETEFDISFEPEEMAEMRDFATVLKLVEGKKG
jgi:acyl carrier protein